MTAKPKTKSRALGDDPLAWITNDAVTEKIEVKKTQSKKTKATKQAVKKTKVKKTQAKKVPAKKRAKKSTPGNESDKAKILQETNIKLDSVLIINDVQTMYAQLEKMLESKQNITIDASAVEMLDTAMLQLLLAFVIKIKAQNKEVIWIKPSVEMISRAATLNLQARLGLDGID